MRLTITTIILLSSLLSLETGAAPEVKQGPGLGQAVSVEQAQRWDLNVYPDGEGLPQGRGSVAEGQRVFEQQCAMCHGVGGVGASADELAGGEAPLGSEVPDKTIGTYWPYATTLFDFIRRAMPMNAPFSLSADQVYAVTAYLLHINRVIPETQELNQANLAGIKMPNREGFYPIYNIPDAR